MSNNQKQQVVALLKSIETGESQPMSAINPQYYTQHNLGAADGLAGVEALLQLLPPRSARVQTIRVFQGCLPSLQKDDGHSMLYPRMVTSSVDFVQKK
jgi:hypothetical protein